MVAKRQEVSLILVAFLQNDTDTSAFSFVNKQLDRLTLACVGGVGWTPPWFFANNSRKKRPIATKLSVPSH